LDARLTTLRCKRITIAKSKGVKTGRKLVEFSKEGFGSKKKVLPIMMIDKFIYDLM
jgi:hypothetical protein